MICCAARGPVTRDRHGAARIRRLVVTSTILCGALAAVWSVVAYKLTHRRGTRAEEVAPSPAWGRLEAHRLKTRDGEEVGAWFVDGRPDAAGVLVLHGHKGNRGHSLGRAELLAAEGYAVLMITLPRTATPPATTTTSASAPQ